jgi:hypothetical protein
MKKVCFAVTRGLRGALIAVCALIGTSAIFAIGANYSMTQGAGTTFASAVISGVNYVQFLLCDPTAGATQCAGVNASGQVAVTGPVTATLSAETTKVIGAVNQGTSPWVVSLPTGASTSALQTTGNTALTTINTTLGTPFQASGSIGNTGFNALQAGTANAVGNPFFVSPGTGATWTAVQATAANLNMTCANCSGSGASGTDEGGFTAGSSIFAPAGGFFQTTATSNPLTTGQWGAWQMTANRAGFVNLRTAAGVELGVAAAPVQVSVANTGANATAMLVTGTGGTFPATQSGTWNVTNVSGTVSLPTGAATAANQTNGTEKTQIVDGSGNVIASTSNNLNVQCANCSGSGVSAADAATFTAGTSLFAPVGGQFTSGGATACVTGHECTVGMTAARAMFGDMSSIAGTATLTGNGTAGAGAQRVTIASDNTAFGVNATLQASATTAIGKVDPNTIATWGLVVSTQNSATPTNGQLIEGQFNTTPTTITSGNVSPLQMDNAGNLLVNIKAGASSGAVAQGSTTSGQTGGLTQAAVTTSAPTYTTAQTSPLSLDTNGNLRVVGTGIAQGSTTSGQTGSMVMGAVTTSAPTYTTAQSSPLSLDTSGNIRVNCTTGCGGGSGGTADADAVAFVAGTTQFTPIGGQFTSGGATACVTAHGCWAAMTADRSLFVNLSDLAGTALGAPSNYGTSPGAVAVQGVNANVTNTVALNQTQYGGTAVVANPCLTGTLFSIPISQTASTQLQALGGSSKKNYVCAFDVVGADAENISLVEGTGTVCATTPAAILGATTAANGYNFAAGSGIAKGNGVAPVAFGSLTSLNNVCLLQSGTGRVSGSLLLAQQ